ncbi:MAG: histidine--tRNA ligase [Lachnospiraceae bacterium]|nr:histidine--tRNA ligase [Lachnospiraceae bacterium]
MDLVKKPVTGMKDILPQEMKIRNYVLQQVRETYSKYGFTEIETPIVEHLGNLCSNQGGENEKLIFRILKRGEKLKLDEAKDVSDLSDSGLRYDLTLPLSRYYSNHSAELPVPFKAFQTGSVFRADRPQRGRFRQFTQCDIDILGDSSVLAETELILATSSLLLKLGFKGFTVHISDRKLLKAMAAASGIDENEASEVFIVLDKMDKIGIEGVKEELLQKGIASERIDSFLGFFLFKQDSSAEDETHAVSELGEKLGDNVSSDTVSSLISIIKNVSAVQKNSDYRIIFDPCLVRGMSYYTGTIFEITIDSFGSSIAGGGRYDGMVERFTGKAVPACGFSIGFERIITMLIEQGFKVPGDDGKVAFLLDKKLSSEKIPEIMERANNLREEGKVVLVTGMMKNKKFQKENLSQEGYQTIEEIFGN